MEAMRSGTRFLLAPTGGLKVVSQYIVEIIHFANMLGMHFCIYAVTVHGTYVGAGMVYLKQPCGVWSCNLPPRPLEEKAQDLECLVAGRCGFCCV